MKIVRQRPVQLWPLQIQRFNQPTTEDVLGSQRHRKKALFIGINYEALEKEVEDDFSNKENVNPRDDAGVSSTKQTDEEEVSVSILQGPHHDVLDMREFVISTWYFFLDLRLAHLYVQKTMDINQRMLSCLLTKQDIYSLRKPT